MAMLPKFGTVLACASVAMMEFYISMILSSSTNNIYMRVDLEMAIIFALGEKSMSCLSQLSRCITHSAKLRQQTRDIYSIH
jgi:hypothetical protein